MKKILSLFVITIFVLTLAACGEDGDLQSIIDDVVECAENPEAEGCEDIIADIIEDETTAEFLAEAVLENWDGDLSHITFLMDSMDMNSAVETTFTFSVLEDEIPNYIHVVVTDNTSETENGMNMHRIIEFDAEGEEIYIEVIYEEVPTGVIVYLNFAPIREMMIEQGDLETADVLDVLGVSEDWLMFKFDDSLANMVELEVVKDLVVSAFYEEFGETFFYDLQEELDLELTIDPLEDYGIDLGMFFDYLVDEDYMSAETMLDTIDYETLLFDLDASYLVPELVIVLNEYKEQLDLASFTTDAHIVSLELLGTEAWLNSLTEDEIVILVDVLIDSEAAEGDPDLSEMLEQYYAGTLDHYLVMLFLNDPEVEMGLSMIPGFDFYGFRTTMDNLDYDAFEMEMIDLELFFEAVYDGQIAFDAYLVDLALTAPQHAAILTHYSGLVLELEPYMYIMDDIEYAFENLDMFDEFFTLDYYLENNLLTTEVEITEEFGILTTVTLEPIAYAYLLKDVIDETVLYLDGFQSFELPYIEYINCPTDEICQPLPEYTELMTNLGMFGEIEITVTYAPSNPNEVITKVDFTDFMNQLIMMDGTVEQASVIDLSIQVRVFESEEIVIPEVVTDMNVVAEDFAKFSLSILAYEALEDIGEYYSMYPEELILFGDSIQLDTFEGYLNLSLAFDLNDSYVEMGGSILSPDLSIQLFWNDGTEVFTSPLGLAELFDIVGPGAEAPDDAATYQYFVDKVNEDNFNMTKLLFVYIFNDLYEFEEVAIPTK